MDSVLRPSRPLLMVNSWQCAPHSGQSTLPAQCCLLGEHWRGADTQRVGAATKIGPDTGAAPFEEHFKEWRLLNWEVTSSGFRILRDQKWCCLYSLSHHPTAYLAHMNSSVFMVEVLKRGSTHSTCQTGNRHGRLRTWISARWQDCRGIRMF